MEGDFLQVQRIAYLNTADIEGKVTADSGLFKPWSIERGCAKECNPFCVTIGARYELKQMHVFRRHDS